MLVWKYTVVKFHVRQTFPKIKALSLIYDVTLSDIPVSESALKIFPILLC